jgi:hypothetical protein
VGTLIASWPREAQNRHRHRQHTAGRHGEAVGKWAYEIGRQRSDADFELLDIAQFNLALLDEPMSATSGQYSQSHTRAWSVKIASVDDCALDSRRRRSSPVVGPLLSWLNGPFKISGGVTYGGSQRR